MNDNDAILAELRKIGAWADMQRKVMKWTFIVMGAAIPIAIIVVVFVERHFDKTIEDLPTLEKKEKPTWGDVDWEIRRANIEGAVKIGEGLIQQTPHYPEGHRRLADAYLAAGRIDKAREHYAEAFRLFPSEENQKLLAATERRIKEGTPQPNTATNKNQP